MLLCEQLNISLRLKLIVSNTKILMVKCKHKNKIL